MGFYGNITDTSRTHFQFDKIFHNRRQMDLECMAGTDNVFVGRFVLVEYDPEGQFFSGDILSGFLGNNDLIYADVDKTLPYIYTNFTRAPSSASATNWDKYYWKNGDYYYKLPSQEYFNAEDAAAGNYWVASVTDPTKTNYLVTNKTLVRLFDSSGYTLTENLYICVGGSNGSPALWEKVISNVNYPPYLINYNIDREYYNIDMDVRGYDATVWQKIYSEGKGKFVFIAKLSGSMPGIELFADPPALVAQAPHLDAKTSDAMYRIHVPSMWGFRIKEVLKDPDTEELLSPSDQQIQQKYFTYDRNNNELSSVNRLIDADIYFNKDGSIKMTRSRDNITKNEILITPTGSSGKYYWNENGDQITIDTYELAVHLPIIGNLISDFYDMFYGEERALDINWYDADDPRKVLGDSLIQGKTFSLDCAAGSINTFHDRLGQIIQPLSSYPSPQQLATLNTDTIYTITNDEDETFYYYKDLDYEYTPVANSDIHYDAGSTLNAQLYEENMYYVRDISTGNYVIANRPFSYYTQHYNDYYHTGTQPLFYKKNVSTIRYQNIRLEQYLKNTYYYKEGDDYILDESENADGPLYPDEPYYKITNANRLNQTAKTFEANQVYRPNVYYYKSEDGLNYILSTELVPNPTINTFYTIDNPVAIGDGYQILYQPNVYYYKENGTYRFDNQGDGYRPERRPYYYIPYDTSELIQIYDAENDRIISGYALDTEHAIAITNFIDPSAPPINNQDVYIRDDTGNYIHISNIEDYSIARIYYMLPQTTEITEFFIPNKYFEYRTANGAPKGYFLASEWKTNTTQYYQLINLFPNEKPFYVSGKYLYYDSGNNIYQIDYSPTMIRNGNTGYFIETGIYVYADSSHKFAKGYKWRDQALFVPASVTLATREIKEGFFQIENINNGYGSLNGAILRAAKMSASADEDNRESNTIMGSINLTNDTLNTLSHTYPQRLLYINDFGQITSTDITLTDLKNLFDRVAALES